MEINLSSTGEISTSNSSNEDVSQYTDADESMSAPTEILAEFLSALMVKDYPTAFKLCKIILQYEPNHETAKEFYPLIRDKILQSDSSAKEPSITENTEDDHNSDHDSFSAKDANGNISESDTDTCSSTSSRSDQRDDEETTASYSSLEDEVVDVNNGPNLFGVDSPITRNVLSFEIPGPSSTATHNNNDISADGNGNSLPSISTNTSDSDSCQEMRLISAKLKSLLSYKRMSNKHSLNSL